MSKPLNALILGIVLALAGGPAVAREQIARVETTSVPEVISSLDRIDVDLAAHEPGLAGLSEKDRQDLSMHKSKVRQLLAGKESTNELQPADRLAAFNSLEAIYGIVAGEREERMICRREHKVGSHRRQTSCMTASQRERAREAAMRSMPVRGEVLKLDP